MSEKETGGPAFPLDVNKEQLGFWNEGMTLRDYFAAKAMQGALSGYMANQEMSAWSSDQMAKYAYEVADEMIEARKS